jgi:K+-sensing histidine kinase KdpD
MSQLGAVIMATKVPTKPAMMPFMKWFTANTIIPKWFPKPLQHPLAIYAAASLVQLIAIGLTITIVALVPDLTFRGALILFGVLEVAWTMGAGPGLLASFIGTILLDFFLTPPLFSLVPEKGADVLNVVLYLLVCLATNWAVARAQKSQQPLTNES